MESSASILLVAGIALLMGCQNNPVGNSADSSPLFEKVPAQASGITFANALQEDVATKQNLLDYDYFYNGAGVGACDLNNDGRLDLVFAGNQVPNRLYLNQGNLQFEDITDESGINTGKQWSTGVTFADVNGDQWMDIYICQGGPLPAAQRRNLLFINQGDLTFRQAAAAYGLADEGIGTQAAFVDVDKDGDLDCFVMNESELYGYDPVRFHRAILENPGKYDGSFSHLYLNEGGKFADRSGSQGINAPTFGLGLVISDINDDYWPDIYVANDYFLPDNLYLNRWNGTFHDRSKVHLKQMSFYGMGADIADINNDGYKDILVLDMASKDHIRSKTLMASMDVSSFGLLVDGLGFSHQYMFNTLQLNNRNGTFTNIGHLAGVAKTDWSWTALATDLDLDGQKDIFVTNGYRRYALDNDFKALVDQAKRTYQNEVPLDVKRELYGAMPSESLPNMVFRNNADLTFAEVGQDWGLEDKTFSNGAVVADLDGDGDEDIVISNIDQEALVYRNNAVQQRRGNYLIVRVEDQLSESQAKVRIKVGDQTQLREIMRVRGYMSAQDPAAHFGLGSHRRIDSVIVTFDRGHQYSATDVEANQVLTVKRSDASPADIQRTGVVQRAWLPYAPMAAGLHYQHVENPFNDFAAEVLLPQKQSTMGPMMSKGDLNGDGLEDLFFGGARGQPGELYLQQPNGSFARASLPVLEQDQPYEDMSSCILDADGDGDNDLVVVSGGNARPQGESAYRHRLYLNDGKGDLRRGNLPLEAEYSGKVVRSFDFDQDGDMDLLIGNRIIPQKYPLAAPSHLLVNEGGRFVDQTGELVPALTEAGIVNDIICSDVNGDGWMDFITVGEWEGIRMYLNREGSFELADYGLDTLKGWWFSIHETDINADGLPDYLVGNIGLNIKHKASSAKPFKVFASDFDQTGTLDIVLSTPYKDQYVPVRGRECSSEQMPMIADKFETYSAFASASLVNIYGEEELANAYQRSANTFASVLLVNRGHGAFETKSLPAEAQAFPLLDAVFMDFDADGFDDVLLAGCIYNTEVETPRLDGGSGLILLSNQQDGYHVAPCPTYCLHIPGNVKSLETITLSSGKSLLLALKNDAGLSMFERKDPQLP